MQEGISREGDEQAGRGGGCDPGGLACRKAVWWMQQGKAG